MCRPPLDSCDTSTMRILVSADERPALALGEILDAWFATAPSDQDDDRANMARVAELDGARARS
jgi:hypothetical protein